MTDLFSTSNPTLLPGQRLLSIKGGFEAAEKYPTPRDCEAAIFDEEEDYLYTKKTDTNGGVTLTRYQLVEDPIPRFDPKHYVTVDDFKSFKEDILDAINGLQKHVPAGQSNKSNGDNNSKQYRKPDNGVNESAGNI